MVFEENIYSLYFRQCRMKFSIYSTLIHSSNSRNLFIFYATVLNVFVVANGFVRNNFKNDSRQIDRERNRWIYGQTDRWTDRQTGRQAERQTDRTGRQTTYAHRCRDTWTPKCIRTHLRYTNSQTNIDTVVGYHIVGYHIIGYHIVGYHIIG